MIIKYLVSALIGLIINLASVAPGFTQTPNDKESELLRKVKITVAKIGTGKNSNIAVNLKDGTKLKGRLVEIKDAYFVLTNQKTGAPTSVYYAEVKQVNYFDPAIRKRLVFAAGLTGALIVLAAVLGIAAGSN